MGIAAWDLWSVALKALSLLAMAGATGTSFVLHLTRRAQCSDLSSLVKHARLCATVGLIAVVLQFLVQVGGVNASGIAGMFDAVMVNILLQSGLGKVLALRMPGLVLITLSLWKREGQAQGVLCIAGIVMLCISFTFTGHVATLSPVPRVLLSLHVLAMMLWMGSLYPLWQMSRATDSARAGMVMVAFGKVAVAIVALLVLSGLYLLTQLLQTAAELWTTAYGAALLLKLAGVTSLLALGALNKMVLVPKLVSTGRRDALQNSIQMEMVLAVLVLIVTSWLTTVTGPVGMG